MNKFKVFVVDDDQDAVSMVTLLLEARGHRVESAMSAVEAIPRIERFRPHVVITDLMMPAFDGEDFCRELRSRHDHDIGRARIIMLSARQESHWADRARALGADAYLTKPVDPASFGEAVEAVFASAVRV